MKTKTRWTAIVFFVIGLVALSIVVHELVHWFQFGGYEKDICLSNRDPMAFVRIYGKNETVNWYPLTEKKRIDMDEVEAILFQFLFIGIGLVYAFKNIDMFGKNVKEKN